VAGNLYGTTKFGGAQNGGTAYKLDSSGSKPVFKVLHSFCAQGASCADGSLPVYDGLAYRGQASGAPYDGTSPLYGTTQYGGMNNAGFSGTRRSGSECELASSAFRQPTGAGAAASIRRGGRRQ